MNLELAGNKPSLCFESPFGLHVAVRVIWVLCVRTDHCSQHVLLGPEATCVDACKLFVLPDKGRASFLGFQNLCVFMVHWRYIHTHSSAHLVLGAFCCWVVLALSFKHVVCLAAMGAWCVSGAVSLFPSAFCWHCGTLCCCQASRHLYRGPKTKLLPRWLGPFTVEHVVGPNAVRLALPDKWRIHPTFHVSLL